MRIQSFALGGGLNITKPIIALKPGEAYVAVNYELAPVAGYRRTKGYERFDGRVSPSDFEYGVAREAQRALIQPVPGSGPVRGAFALKGSLYAFRNTANGMAKKLYRATPAGWVEVMTPVLNPGGQGEFILNNFYGGTTTLAIYGVDGVNKAFQFDGTTFTQITTGSEPLFPTHIAEFRNHLFLSYPGGSLQNSATGDPLDYTAINGAGEIGAGDEIQSLLELQGNSLAVFCLDRISILQGTSAENFTFQLFSDSGVKPGTVQPLFSDAIFLDKQIQRLQTSQSFGDFQANSLSEPVRPIVEDLLDLTRLFSVVSRSKNQYMLFGERGDVLVATFNGGRLSGFTRLTLAHQFLSVHVTESISGKEELYACGEDGYVYQLDKGTSFDGQKILSLLLLAPNHVSAYEQKKRFRKVVLELDAPALSVIRVFAEFDYGASPRAASQEFSTRPQGSVFNDGRFNEAYWSGDLKGYATAYVEGHGRNITVFIYNESDQDESFILESMAIGYDIRGQVR